MVSPSHVNTCQSACHNFVIPFILPPAAWPVGLRVAGGWGRAGRPSGFTPGKNTSAVNERRQCGQQGSLQKWWHPIIITSHTGTECAKPGGSRHRMSALVWWEARLGLGAMSPSPQPQLGTLILMRKVGWDTANPSQPWSRFWGTSSPRLCQTSEPPQLVLTRPSSALLPQSDFC